MIHNFFYIESLSKKMNKKDHDILRMVHEGIFPAYCFYEGYAESMLRIPNKIFKFRGFVLVVSNIIYRILHGKYSEIQVMYPYDDQCLHCISDMLLPMQINDITGAYIEQPISVTISDLVIMSHDIERAEEEHPSLCCDNEAQKKDVIKIENLSTYKEEVRPSIQNEKPLIGRKAIADYLGVSISCVKNYMKNQAFPNFLQGGLQCAYPSDLEAWRQRKKNK